MNNIKLLLPAYAKKQLSDSGGRRVVDKMFDVSLNRRIVEWSGTDRPEFIDFGGSKVCVEAERENSMPDSRDMTTWGSAGTGGVTVSRDATGYDGEPNAACTITGGGDQNDRAFTNVSVPDDSNTHCGSVFVKKGTGVIRFYTYVFGGTQVTASSVLNTSTGEVSGPGVVEDWGGWWRIWQTVTNNSSGNTTYQMRLYPSQDAPYTGSAIFDQAQIELNAAYPTLPIVTSGSPVTRLAPTVPIQNALPLTGTIAGKVDMVRTVGITQYLIDNGGATGVDRFLLTITSGGDLGFMPFSDTSYAIQTSFPFDVDDKERFTLEYAGSYDGSNAYLFVRVGGEQYLFTGSYTVGDDSVRDVQMGARNGSGQSSMRWEVLHHKDNIIRTTESEFEQLFEVIS